MEVTGSETQETVDAGSASPPIAYADPSTPEPRQVLGAQGITRGDVAAIVVRLLGIYVILQGLPLIAPLFESRFDLVVTSVYGLVLTAFELVGIFLVWKATRLGLWLLPSETEAVGVPPGSSSPLDWQAVAFSVVGVVLACEAAPVLAHAFVRYTYESVYALAHGTTPSSLLLTLFRPTVQLLLGTGLFFYGKRLSHLWQRTRAMPLPRNDDAGPL